MTRWFYEVSPEMHRRPAEMYIADPRFADHYERIAPGLATYVHDLHPRCDHRRRRGGPGK
jgi:hypothetical protein